MTAPAFPLTAQALDRLIATALDEDVGPGDVTVESCIPPEARLRAVMAARQPLTVCGLAIAEAVFRRLDPAVQLVRRAEDGETVGSGSVLLALDGQAGALLSAERTALNFVQHLSGIATVTRAYADAIAGTGATLLDTRKTIPGLRLLAKYAAACGGAHNHRLGLYDAVMIKDNHIAVAGSVRAAVEAAHRAGQSRIQVECDTLEQVEDALSAGATSLLLDNMDPDRLRQAVALVKGRIPLEASGGISFQSIRAVAETGVDFISVGRLTQSAPACDIGLDYTHGL